MVGFAKADRETEDEVAISQEALDEATRVMERRAEAMVQDDRRGQVCACGHPMTKHDEVAGGWLCIAGRIACPCRSATPVLKVPNARAFCYKTDEAGHAVMKGIYKTAEQGRANRLEWVATCSACGAEPVTVVAVEGGKLNEPRCGTHR